MIAVDVGYGQLAWRPNPALTIAYQVETERTDAFKDRFSHDDHVVAGSVSWRGAVWQLGAAVRSGVSRYRHAPPKDSNYWRRDQWIEASPSLGRRLNSGLTLVGRATVMNQTSTRRDRTFDVQSFRLGLEWATTGE